MNHWGAEWGKLFIVLGLILILVGLLFWLGDKLPFNLGRLPGDIVYKKGNFTFYFPWVTCLILSIVLTILFSLFRR